MKRAEYQAEVADIAAQVLEEARDGGHLPPYPIPIPEMRAQVEDTLWETVDGHEWVIYTYRAQQVLAVSANSGYTPENFGPEMTTDESGHINWSALAFGALYADVTEVIWDLLEDLETEEQA